MAVTRHVGDTLHLAPPTGLAEAPTLSPAPAVTALCVQLFSLGAWCLFRDLLQPSGIVASQCCPWPTQRALCGAAARLHVACRYFGAHADPESQGFLPKLRQFYMGVKARPLPCQCPADCSWRPVALPCRRCPFHRLGARADLRSPGRASRLSHRQTPHWRARCASSTYPSTRL